MLMLQFTNEDIRSHAQIFFIIGVDEYNYTEEGSKAEQE